MLPRIYKSAVQQFITQDKALSFTSPINDAPAYWKKFLHEALAMIKQVFQPLLTVMCRSTMEGISFNYLKTKLVRFLR